MQGIYFLLSLVFLGVIIRWFIANDSLTPGEPTKGLLRIERDPLAKGAADKARQSGGRRERAR